MIRAGNIVRVRKGAAVAVGREVKRQRQDYVAVVYCASIPADGMNEAVVTFVVGDDYRDVNEGSVELLDDGVHELHVGGRRITGGSPIRGGGNHYTTEGECSCGRRFKSNGQTAREVRARFREHVLWLADPKWRELEQGYIARDVADVAAERARYEQRRAARLQ